MYELLFVLVVMILYNMVLLNYSHIQKEVMVAVLDGILLHQTLRDKPKNAHWLCLADAVVSVHGLKSTCRFQELS